jgi:signal transduction histidine kinase
VSVRTRLLLPSLVTLAVGLGALLVLGNVLLRSGVRTQATSVLRARVDAQLAALVVTPRGVAVHESPNDDVLDRRSWVISGRRVIERPADVSAALDAAAVALGRQRRTAERDGPDDIRLRSAPVPSPGAPRANGAVAGSAPVASPDSRRAIGAVVVGFSMTPLERLQHYVALGSLVFAALVLITAFLATRGALDGALRPVAQMTAHAEDWGAHDLDRRFALGPARDELTGLAATLDGLLSRIAASRRHEQRFASEVAHELRTPRAGAAARQRAPPRARAGHARAVGPQRARAAGGPRRRTRARPAARRARVRPGRAGRGVGRRSGTRPAARAPARPLVRWRRRRRARPGRAIRARAACRRGRVVRSTSGPPPML